MRVEPTRIEQFLGDLRQGRFSYGKLLLGLYGATFCIRASFGMAIILLSAYLPLDQAAYGVFIATAPLAELASVPFVGVANDRYGRRAILLTGLGVAGFSLLGRIFTQNTFVHIGLNGLHGLAAALILVTSLALLAEWAREDSRGREMGVFDFVNLFGWMVGFILGLVVKDLLIGQLWLGFALATLITVVGIAVAWPTVREPAGHRSARMAADLGDFAAIATKPRIALVLAPWLIVFVFIGSFSGFMERLATALGFTGIEAALGLTVLGVVFLVSQVGYGRLSDIYGRDPLIQLGAWGFLAFTATVGLLVLHSGSPTGLDTAALLDQLPLFGPLLGLSLLATLAFGPAALAALADEAQDLPSGVTMSLYSFVVALGFILGPAITGPVVGFSGSGGLAVLLLVEGIGLVVLVVLRSLVMRRLGPLA